MKKISFILLIIAAVCTFCACSEDEAWVNDSPVVGYVLPSYVMKGTQVVIPGKGYSAEAELYFKDEDGVSTQMNPEKITNTGILFTVPEDMARGVYSVILKQDGEWELGSTKIAEIIKVKRVKSLSWDFGDFLLSCGLEYDDDNNLISFESLNNGKYTLTYEGGQIKVVSESASFSYTLEGGKITSSTQDGETLGWTYSPEGYLESAAGNHYTYENGNLITTDYSDMALGSPFVYTNDGVASLSKVDVAACCMWMNDAMGDMDFLAYLLKMNGKQSVQQPAGLSGLGDFTYEYDSDGDVSRFVLTHEEFGEMINVVLQYEMGDILVME